MNHPLQILVVDDSPSLLRVTTRVLQSAGYHTLEAADGQQALQLAREKQPDLILLDVVLPDINGLEVCRQIKAAPELAHIYVVLCSAQKITSEYQAEGLEAGADGYITRPISNRELLARVQAMLRLKQTEEALRVSREKFRSFFEQSGDGIVLTDEQGYLVEWNPAQEAITGLKAQEVLGRPVWNVQFSVAVEEQKTSELYEHLKAVTLEFLQTGRADWANTPVEIELVRPDGSRRTIQIIAFAIKTGKGFMAASINRDITRQKQMEQAMQQYAAQLEARNREIKQLVYIVSHDLQTPLINLSGFTAELRRAVNRITGALAGPGGPNNETARQTVDAALQTDIPEAFTYIEAALGQMRRLVTALLDLARLGRRELHLEPVDMNCLVQETLAALNHQVDRQNVTVTVGQLPTIPADRTAMQQIMANLLSNAVKYLDPSRPGRIEITANRSGRQTTFHIHDNGQGINPKEMDKVFAPFRRAGQHTVPGEGMGLAYVQTLVRRHGGEIWCESEPGVGSTFSFTIAEDVSLGENNV